MFAILKALRERVCTGHFESRAKGPRLRTSRASRYGLPADLVGGVAAAAVLLTASFAMPALAEPSTATDAADAYVVPSVTPNGTKVNLFDYWAYGGATTNDYWLTADGIAQNEGSTKNEGPIDDLTLSKLTLDAGINHDHQLKFTRGFKVGTLELNKLNNNKLMEGMFASSLVGGYPQLNAGQFFTNDSNTEVSLNVEKPESLAYLFNSDTSVDGKAAHLNVGGLFQVEDGYYTYDSLKNFASYDEGSNSFKVYNAPAINPAHSKNMGQFFPFNTADDVFEKGEDGYKTMADGKLVARNDLSATGAIAPNNYDKRNAEVTINHFFGMSMTTRFMQPQGGTVDENGETAMTYHFSGDDDALFYIDGILVGNLGGIHSALSFDIDFQTGKVTFYRIEDNGTKEIEIAEPTTLRAIFEEAHKDGLVSDDYMAANFTPGSDTFADNTIHDLQFFYLERGNLDSNLSLKFNLAEVPETEVVKVDQDGEGIEGVEFKMYAAKKDTGTGEYTKVDLEGHPSNDPIASGTTDANGGLILHLANGLPINYDDIFDKFKIENYILEEVAVPEGYRFPTGETSPQIKLKYLHSVATKPEEKVKGYIVDDGGSAEDSTAWENGVFAAGRELLQASQNVCKSTANSGGADKGDVISEDELNEGTLFAVIFKRDTSVGGDELADARAWHAVWGTATGGYNVSDNAGLDSVLDAVDAQNASTYEGYGVYTFDRNRANVLTTTIDELPGMLSEYYWLLKEQGADAKDARFAVSVYFAPEKKSVKDIKSTNDFYQVYSDDFARTYSAKLSVPNIKNELYVQKVDGAALEGGKLYEGVPGAEFSLYEADAVTVAADGAVSIADGTLAYDTVTTSEDVDLKELKYGASFPSKGKVLKNGVYYLKETKAPEGYKLNSTITKVIVDGTGVYADAGTDTDDVSVSVGVGRLVKSLAQFATNDKLDNTLSNITAQPRLGQVADDGASMDQGAWDEDSFFTPSTIHLKHTDAAPLEYALSYDQGIAAPSYTTTTGWPHFKVSQCVEHGEEQAQQNGANYTIIGGDRGDPAEITQLFSGTTVVHVGDEPLASFEVKKAVVADGTAPGADVEFSFKVKVDTDGLGQQDRELPYVYRVFDANGEGQGDYALLPDDGIIKIRADQTFRVYEVPAGAKVSVSEVDLPGGYALTKVTDGSDREVTVANDGVTWTLETNADDQVEIIATNSLTFTNTYAPNWGINITKKMEDAALEAGKFRFTIERVSREGPEVSSADASFLNPKGAKGEVVSLGTKLVTTFTDSDTGKTYVYKVSEDRSGETSDGIEHDVEATGAAYVYVTVDKDGGAIKTETTVVKGRGVDGAEASADMTPEELDKWIQDSGAGNLPGGYAQRLEATGLEQLVAVPFVNRYKPTVPETPVTPTTPETPTTPTTPETPTTPTTPETPTTPTTPETPTTPTTPETPVTPTTPETPETPVTPATPEEPAVPVTPVSPTSPSDPSSPETPGTPATPNGDAPQTGDPLVSSMAVLLTGVVAAALVSAGVILRFRDR